jgi:hypothetical protein
MRLAAAKAAAPVGPRIVEVERVIERRHEVGVLAEPNPGVKDTRH